VPHTFYSVFIVILENTNIVCYNIFMFLSEGRKYEKNNRFFDE